MQERLAGAFERTEHRFDRTAMAGIGGIHRSVGRARGLAQNIGIVERAEHRRDAELFQCRRALIRARQAAHLMAGLHQRHRQRTADIAGGAGDEDFHTVSSAACDASVISSLARIMDCRDAPGNDRMTLMQTNLFDIVVIVVAIIAIVTGFNSGLLRSLATIFGYLCAAPVAVMATPPLAQLLGTQFHVPPAQLWVEFFAVFLVAGHGVERIMPRRRERTRRE